MTKLEEGKEFESEVSRIAQIVNEVEQSLQEQPLKEAFLLKSTTLSHKRFV